MRRLIAPAVVLVALALAGCSGTSGSISQQEFLKSANTLPSFEPLTDKALAELGQSVCDAFDGKDVGERKLTAASFASASEKQGESAGEALEFVDLAVARYCPGLTAK